MRAHSRAHRRRSRGRRRWRRGAHPFLGSDVTVVPTRLALPALMETSSGDAPGMPNMAALKKWQRRRRRRRRRERLRRPSSSVFTARVLVARSFGECSRDGCAQPADQLLIIPQCSVIKFEKIRQ